MDVTAIDPEADPREGDYRRYWREPEDKKLSPAFWNDPRPNVTGILTSEWIAFYHREVGRMIRPFDPSKLKVASYELTLGWRCVVEGEQVLLSEKNPYLRIPRNSVAFVSMQQVLLLPHYLAGRFDLAIKFIYQGLLLGTGPQVDPGFQGALGCPLHNISNDDIFIRLGEPFAKIDFAKCTPPLNEPAEFARRHVGSEKELREWLDGQPRERQLRLFKGGRVDWREPIFAYTEGRRPRSSVASINRRVQQFQRLGIVGLLGLALSGAGLVTLYVNARTEGVEESDEVVELRDGQVRDLREQLERLRRAQPVNERP